MLPLQLCTAFARTTTGDFKRAEAARRHREARHPIVGAKVQQQPPACAGLREKCAQAEGKTVAGVYHAQNSHQRFVWRD
jgi:Tfp pilus assembly protein PilX